MKTINLNIVLMLIIISIGILSYTSYLAGFKAAQNNMDALLMTMSIDSNLVTTGLYEELPNNVRKTMHFYIEDTPTVVKDVKLFAEVKYATIGGEVINLNDGTIWNLIKQDRVFQRKFDDKKDSAKQKCDVPNSNFANNQLFSTENKNSL
ncbi:MAG: hypothetical protein KDC88_07160 [Ignavibacteriae bacterium]|nr:hypothetical protein [Ignavibacteriota bacterium]MCB9209441.1 hypothetical protein [Ignavibacteriales bacterium]MCB9258084.1 hypothetical protein [Ignavibacteriales bacterium]